MRNSTTFIMAVTTLALLANCESRTTRLEKTIQSDKENVQKAQIDLGKKKAEANKDFAATEADARKNIVDEHKNVSRAEIEAHDKLAEARVKADDKINSAPQDVQKHQNNLAKDEAKLKQECAQIAKEGTQANERKTWEVCRLHRYR